MKKTLGIYFSNLKAAYYNYDYFTPDGGHTFQQNEVEDILEEKFDNLVNKYCEFIDVYSVFCDDVIEKSNDECFISQVMLFYYMMNKEYFASKCEEDDIKNVIHIINQIGPHKEILNYEFFYKREDELILCELCGGEGDIPDCVLCGRPADYSSDKEISQRKYTFVNEYKGPFCKTSDIKMGNKAEIYCNLCKKYYKANNYTEHCKTCHGGYIMEDTEANHERNLKRDIIDQCEDFGCDEDEINYVLDNYSKKYFSFKEISRCLAKYTKDPFYNTDDSSDDYYSSSSDDNIKSESSYNSNKCNTSPSENVSEDEKIKCN